MAVARKRPVRTLKEKSKVSEIFVCMYEKSNEIDEAKKVCENRDFWFSILSLLKVPGVKVKREIKILLQEGIDFLSVN